MSAVICCDAVTYNTNKKLINAAVSHELVHLYDDWLHYDLYNTSLNSDDRIEKGGIASSISQKFSDDNLFENILFMIYLTSSAEKKAFTAEVVNDLKHLGCTRYNFNEKVRQTSTWRNYNKTNNYIQNVLKTCSDTELEYINGILKTRYTKCGVPFVQGHFMSFSEYRKKLSIWSEKITKKNEPKDSKHHRILFG